MTTVNNLFSTLLTLPIILHLLAQGPLHVIW